MNPQPLVSSVLLSVSINLPSPGASCNKTPTVLILLCLSSFTYDIFRVHPWCSMCQDFIPFYMWITGRFQTYHISYTCSSIARHLGDFHSLAIVNNALNIAIQMSAQVSVFHLLGLYSGAELLGHVIILCLTFWGHTKQFGTEESQLSRSWVELVFFPDSCCPF